jgi:hypothetical protein
VEGARVRLGHAIDSVVGVQAKLQGYRAGFANVNAFWESATAPL